MRYVPKPNAAPRTAAGATREPTGRPRVLMMSTDTTTCSTAIATDEMTDATADHPRCDDRDDYHKHVRKPLVRTQWPNSDAHRSFRV
jgi:hypothetical protein